MNERCCFCDKRKDEINLLVEGRGHFICDECITLAVAAAAKFKREKGPAKWRVRE